METETRSNIEIKLKNEDHPKKQDNPMTSSTVSSLASPVDSGVQLLDSESEIASLMSGSAIGCDIPLDSDCNLKISGSNDKIDGQNSEIIHDDKEKGCSPSEEHAREKYEDLTKSDIANENNELSRQFSKSIPSYFDKFDIASKLTDYRTSSRDCCHMSNSKSLQDEVFEMEHPIKSNTESDLMNISLNSYELLDYTIQNKDLKDVPPDNVDMHVSLSEEVNENLKIALSENAVVVPENIPIVEDKEVKPVEEQIVFRRQRKKKSKSDTPKKRVSFHEDILNSTKIDDIHINHGFVTIEPDVSLKFFQRGFLKKADVVQGRYSWAAEGDAPYYEKNNSEREIKSDIYVNQRYSSTSSSSTGSISSSIDEEDTSDDNVVKKEPTQKLPKSSCLKKTKQKKIINTNIVQEEIKEKRRSDSNILDANIFGSLKNILSFSTSVPLAERGVPEGQEDVTAYASSVDVSFRRKGSGSLSLKPFEAIEIKPPPLSTTSAAKSHFKLTQSEGFYPNYPQQSNLPTNIILCDSNVYEHKGISYSYEYDKFQKTFEQQTKPKSSTVLQSLFKEFSFFRKKAKEMDPEEDFEIIPSSSTPVKEDDKNDDVQEVEVKSPPCLTQKSTLNKYASSLRLDWDDIDTISESSKASGSKHLNSPKRKFNNTNHYSLSPFKVPLSERSSNENIIETSKSLPTLRPASSKTSLINRFLKNVTLKKLLDARVNNKIKNSHRYMNLYVKNLKIKPDNTEIDAELEREIILGKERQNMKEPLDQKLLVQLKKDIFRSKLEKLIKIFPVRSAYTTNGDSKPLLLILTSSTLYIASSKFNQYTNHFVLPFTDLNTILIGPNGQIVHISNQDNDMQCMITTGCSNITLDLISQIELAMRRDFNKPRLPAINQLSMRDMYNLRRAICKQTSVCKDEEYFYYSIVNIQDFLPDTPVGTPMGPTKEGPLMFKTSESDSLRWETAYFILKAGVLYMLSSASQRVPMRVFPLMNGSCQGARRVFNSLRPHTFQLIVDGKSLLLAAPDEYVASEWLQELVHAASRSFNQKEKTCVQSCSLLMTSEHILTVRESFPYTVNSLLLDKNARQSIKGPQVLSCAGISDLTSFRLPSAEQSWCILEFACREVHECSGDWILYFASNAELENFISTLEMLWHYNNDNDDSFPLSTIPETDPLSKKCVDVYTSLLGTWPSNTVLLQFL